MKSCVTISLVEEARGGPFIFWNGLRDGCEKAKALGFDAVEVFPPGVEAIDTNLLQSLLSDHGLELAAVGTGAGMVKHGLSLTSTDATERQRAKDFVRSIIDLAGQFGASAIIGSMQGRWNADLPKADALALLGEAINELGPHASQYGASLIYEPLNRYETNLCNTMADGVEFLSSLNDGHNCVLLADLFHMNIEETCISQAIRDAGSAIGHVHFVDSNRRPAGLGHMSYEPIVDALRSIQYDRFISAEAFAYPEPDAAAKQTIDSFNKYFG